MSTAATVLQRILYVEDEPDIRQIAKLALEAVGGFTVELCASGEEALRGVSRFKPDLILLDVMMPGMDGPTTLRKLRELPESRQTPAIFMTAKIQPQEILELKRVGALAVIPKPFDPMTLAQAVRDIWSAHYPNAAAASAPKPAVNTVDSIQEITRHFADSVPERIEEITALIRALCAGEASVEERQTLYRKVHSLNGSAKTFGMGSLSAAARALELQLKPLAPPVDPHDATDLPMIASLTDALVQTAGQHAAPGSPLSSAARLPQLFAEPEKLVYVFANVGDWAQEVCDHLQSCGYETCTFASAATLLAACVERLPAAVLTDVSDAPGDLRGAQTVARLRDTYRAAPPVIFVSNRDDLDTRLQAARAGGVAYFTRPVKMSALVDKIEELSGQAAPDPYRVMIVEDAEEQAALCAAVLRQASMLTCVVSDPQQLLKQLADFHPDLVLMDMYLPGCTGDELARIIRQMESFVGLPIVFLSVESDFDRQLSAMGLGGDEFLTKPILPAQLVSVVGSRVRHYRKLRALMVQDSLTGLANHSRLQQALETEVARAVRQKIPLALVMIDIDYFKQVNDRFGHPVGDRVLQGLARFLRQRLRQSDVVARYGGEEFAVVMSNTDGANALMVMERLRSHFATLVHESDKAESFSVTFSAGVAALTAQSTARALLLAADRNLYSAKERGRNCVVL